MASTGTGSSPFQEVLLGVFVDLIIALLGVVPAYLVGDWLEVYPASLSVALAAVLLAIGGVTVHILTSARRPNRMAWGTGVAALMVIGIYAALMVSQPWCHVDAVYFQVEQEGLPQPITVFDGQAEVAPRSTVRVRAVPSTDEVITCRWEYRGDGDMISSDECTTLVQLGADRADDILSVTAWQPSCRLHLIKSLFMRGNE
jgi:hypothetical protein